MKQSRQAIWADSGSPDDLAAARQTTGWQNASRTVRLPAADILRGLAASWVFLFHASAGRHIDGLVRALPDALASVLFSAGHLGVAVFFVLSGLVIAMSGERCGDGLAPAANFLARRLVRLAPPYYVSLAVVLAFLLLKKKVEVAGATLPEPAAIAAHLLFLQDLLDIPALNSVYWTLCIEIQFYFMFCALMLLARWLGRGRLAGHGWLAVIGTACAVAALWPLGLAADDATWHASFLPTWHLFLLGLLLHHALKPGPYAAAPYFVYLAVLAAAAIVDRNVFTLSGVATSIVLYGLSHWPAEGAWKRFRLLTNLGLISYSFYLLHNPITGAAFNVIRRLGGSGIAAELGGLVLSFCLCVLAAGISYIAIERPAIRWGRRLRS
jgi:peptidoglycan/LPS O-acetylase OafA/YrhL